MLIEAHRSDFASIGQLRALYLQACNFQIRYDACHGRGWADYYLLRIDGEAVGYGAVKGLDDRAARDAIFEFYLIKPCQNHASAAFAQLVASSRATHIECQSNEPLLSAMLHLHAGDIRSDAVLFEDYAVTALNVPGFEVRRRRESDVVFPHTSEPVGDIVAVKGDEVVASAGYLCHYNPPFADLFMEVHPDYRRQGLGAWVVQEAKRACYLAGRVPAARCAVANEASRRTLIKAGLRLCGFMLQGRLLLTQS